MRNVLIVLFLMFPLLALAQNKQSDYLSCFVKEYKTIEKVVNERDAIIKYVLYCEEADTACKYGAILMRKKFKEPRFVELFTKNVFDDGFSNFDSEQHKSVWSKVLPYLDGIENIYFQSVGTIDNFPIEYLSVGGKEMVCEKYNIYRVTAIKELLRKNNPPITYKTAALYGGIYYNTDTLTISEIVEYYNLQTENPPHLHLSLKLPFLKGTDREVKTIDTILTSVGIKSHLYNDIYAVEESFKKLSGQSTDIIHLATHAFNLSKEQNLSAVTLSGTNSLSDCKRFEDGILTSDEINKLDFTNVDMLVLSTNATDIYKSFKNAGAHTIIRSCDRVEDNATMALMIEFYNNLVSGHSKRQSLVNAIKTIKNTERYSKPRYWAAFIMEDGLN